MDAPKELWFVAKLVTADYCFQAGFDPNGAIPDFFEVKHMTKLIFTADGAVQYGMWGPEKIGMITGPIVMRRQAILAIAAASEVLVNDVENAWGMKTIVGQIPKRLILPQ